MAACYCSFTAKSYLVESLTLAYDLFSGELMPAAVGLCELFILIF